MAVGDAYVFPGFLTQVVTQLFFPKPPTTFLTCFCRGQRRKYAGKKCRFNCGSNSQPSGHESDTLTTEPPGQGLASTGNQTHNHKVMSLTCSPLSHPGGAKTKSDKGENVDNPYLLLLQHIAFLVTQNKSDPKIEVCFG